jgi:hypothetical protein
MLRCKMPFSDILLVKRPSLIFFKFSYWAAGSVASAGAGCDVGISFIASVSEGILTLNP